jgi:hypothetical protein
MTAPDVIETTAIERAIARAQVLGIFGTNNPNPIDDDTEE